jgi:hypothetical protein
MSEPEWWFYAAVIIRQKRMAGEKLAGRRIKWQERLAIVGSLSRLSIQVFLMPN